MQLSVTLPSSDSLLAAFAAVGPLPAPLAGATTTAGVPTLDGFADVLANTVAPTSTPDEKPEQPLLVAAPPPIISLSWLPAPQGEETETAADPMAAPRADSIFPGPAKPLERPTDETIAAALAFLVPPPVATPPQPETIEIPHEEPALTNDTVDAEEGSAPEIPFSASPTPTMMPRPVPGRAPEIPPVAVRDFSVPAPAEALTSVAPSPPSEVVPADLPIGRVLIPYAAPRVARAETPEAPERAPGAFAPLSDVAQPKAVIPQFGNSEPPAPLTDASALAAPRVIEESKSPMPAIEPPAMVADDDTAKIAVAPAPDAPKISPHENLTPRNFVSSPEKQLTPRRANLGTGVAKTIDAMPYASTSPHASAPADFEPVSLVVERVTSADQGDATAPTPEPATLSTAHRAVEAVLTAAHRFSTGERHAVSLQFSVGGADLDVRVELRADEVRATFRTDSADLRAALAQEWDAAALAGGDRSFRLAPPVFAANDASGFSAFSGDQAAHQQQRQSASRRASEFPTTGVARGRGARDAVAASDFVSNSAPRVPLSTALHLHTLA